MFHWKGPHAMTYKPKLTPIQVRSLLDDVARGVSKKDVAARYGVSIRTVYRRLKMPPPDHRGNRRRAKERRMALKPCGTDAAYRRHKRRGEYPCLPCLEAHAADVRKRSNGSA